MCRSAVLVPFLAAYVAAVSKSAGEVCPKDLVCAADEYYLQEWNGYCFHFVLYRERDYSDAKNDCSIHGGTLAMPKTEALNKFLFDTMVKHYEEHSEVWIGLHDLQTEGTYMWEDATPMEWNNFAAKNGPHRSWWNPWAMAEDCVALDPDDVGQWHDYQCERSVLAFASWSYYYKKYICQYPPGSGGRREQGDWTVGTEDCPPVGKVIGDHISHDEKVGGETDDDDQRVDDKGKGKKGDDEQLYDEKGDGKKDNDEQFDDEKGEGKKDDDEQLDDDKGEGEKDDDDEQLDDDEADDLAGNPSIQFVSDDGCPPFQCEIDCGMRGFKIDQNDCQVCSCN